MSAAMEWAWAVKCPDPSTRVVLLALARRADNTTYECFPRQRQIAEDAQVSLATVKRALAKLVEMNLIIAQPRLRSDGSKMSSVYRMLVNTIHLMPDGEQVQVVPETGQEEPTLAQDELSLTLTPNSTSSIPSTPTLESNHQPQCKEGISEDSKGGILEKSPEGKTCRRHAWKEGAEISQDWLDWAIKDRLWARSDAELEARRFTDSALANRRLYADWFAAWRNWCRSPYCKTPKGKPKIPVRIDRW